MKIRDRDLNQVYHVDFMDFAVGWDPGWADLILTSPSGRLVGKDNNMARWLGMMYYSLRYNGVLAITHVAQFPKKHALSITEAGFRIQGMSHAPGMPGSSRGILVAHKGVEAKYPTLPEQIDGKGKRLSWGSGAAIEMVELLVKTYSKKGDIILDPFMGEGATAVMALQTKRKWVGCEINVDTYNRCLDRIERETDWRRDAVQV